MENYKEKWRKLPVKYGFLLFFALTAYFLIMVLLDLAQHHWLRIFNYIIIFFMIRAVMIKFRKVTPDHYENFTNLFNIAVRAAVVGVGTFSIFIAIYLEFDPRFFEALIEMNTQGGYIQSPIAAACLIFVEGFVSSLATAFVLAQILKKPTIEKPTAPPPQKHQRKN